MDERIKEVAKSAIKKAGKFIREEFGKRKKVRIVEKKGIHDFAINIDRNAERIIIRELKMGKVECEILTEERGKILLNKNTYKVYIDPLDGSVNYFFGIPHFCTSLAFEENGKLIFSIVYDPIKDEIFVGEKESGAYLNDRKIKVSNSKKLNDCCCGFCWDLERAKYTTSILEELTEFKKVRVLGSANLDLCYVACGRFDCLIGLSLSPWDIAGGAFIVEKAGGTVTNLKGLEWNPYCKDILATNSKIHKRILDIIAPVV